MYGLQESFSLTRKIVHPTRVTVDSSSTNDNFLADDDPKTASVIKSQLSKHNAQFIRITIDLYNEHVVNNQKSILVMDFSDTNKSVSDVGQRKLEN